MVYYYLFGDLLSKQISIFWVSFNFRGGSQNTPTETGDKHPPPPLDVHLSLNADFTFNLKVTLDVTKITQNIVIKLPKGLFKRIEYKQKGFAHTEHME